MSPQHTPGQSCPQISGHRRAASALRLGGLVGYQPTLPGKAVHNIGNMALNSAPCPHGVIDDIATPLTRRHPRCFLRTPTAGVGRTFFGPDIIIILCTE